jgi:hypothetical protein
MVRVAGMMGSSATMSVVLASGKPYDASITKCLEQDHVLVRAYLLFPVPRQARMVEVKAAASLKDYYLQDCALQSRVIES